MFGKKCVQIFTPDGAAIANLIPPEKVYKETIDSNGSTHVCCDFYHAVSNGKKVRPLFFLSAPFVLCSLTLLTLVTSTH